jgi:hypothetical protein
MRDIGTRIKRYRLSRYAPPVDKLRRGLRWAWVAVGLWLVWVTALSDHSFYRLWQLGRESARNDAELRRLTQDLGSLDRETSDPRLRKRRAEAILRESGMARKGEIVYRIEDRAPPPDSDAEKPAPPRP